jgi:hypothetical protein
MAFMRSHVSMRLWTTLLAAASLGGSTQASPRAVLELFTSQGCSSCPPADKLFAKLARDSDVITLSLPVDYWDRLGWKDTFAKHAFTERQVAYSNVRGDDQVYTPQAVVNGMMHAVGSQRSAIDAAVTQTAASLVVPLDVKRAADDIVVSVGAAEGGGARQGTVVLLPFLASRDVAIGRGENARDTVTYTNIVRDIVPIADWTGKPIARTIPLERYKDYDGVAVLLQAGSPSSPGAILGAGRVILR